MSWNGTPIPSLSKEDMKAALKSLGISTTGLKVELERRLIDAVKPEASITKDDESATKEEESLSEDDLKKLTCEALRTMLKNLQLPIYGKKTDLIERIRTASVKNSDKDAVVGSDAAEGDVAEMSFQALRVALKQLGLPANGKKSDMIVRLNAARAEQQQPLTKITAAKKGHNTSADGVAAPSVKRKRLALSSAAAASADPAKTPKTRRTIKTTSVKSPPVVSILASTVTVDDATNRERAAEVEEKRSGRMKRTRAKRAAASSAPEQPQFDEEEGARMTKRSREIKATSRSTAKNKTKKPDIAEPAQPALSQKQVSSPAVLNGEVNKLDAFSPRIHSTTPTYAPLSPGLSINLLAGGRRSPKTSKQIDASEAETEEVPHAGSRTRRIRRTSGPKSFKEARAKMSKVKMTSGKEDAPVTGDVETRGLKASTLQKTTPASTMTMLSLEHDPVPVIVSSVIDHIVTLAADPKSVEDSESQTSPKTTGTGAENGVMSMLYVKEAEVLLTSTNAGKPKTGPEMFVQCESAMATDMVNQADDAVGFASDTALNADDAIGSASETALNADDAIGSASETALNADDAIGSASETALNADDAIGSASETALEKDMSGADELQLPRTGRLQVSLGLSLSKDVGDEGEVLFSQSEKPHPTEVVRGAQSAPVETLVPAANETSAATANLTGGSVSGQASAVKRDGISDNSRSSDNMEIESPSPEAEARVRQMPESVPVSWAPSSIPAPAAMTSSSAQEVTTAFDSKQPAASTAATEVVPAVVAKSVAEQPPATFVEVLPAFETKQVAVPTVEDRHDDRSQRDTSEQQPTKQDEQTFAQSTNDTSVAARLRYSTSGISFATANANDESANLENASVGSSAILFTPDTAAPQAKSLNVVDLTRETGDEKETRPSPAVSKRSSKEVNDSTAERDERLLEELENALLEATMGGITKNEFEVLDSVLRSFVVAAGSPEQRPRSNARYIMTSPESTGNDMNASFMNIVHPTPRHLPSSMWGDAAPTPIHHPGGRNAPSAMRSARGGFTAMRRPPVPLFSPNPSQNFAVPPTPTNLGEMYFRSESRAHPGSAARPKSVIAERIRNALKEDQVPVARFVFSPPSRVVDVPPLVRKDLVNNVNSGHTERVFRFET